MRTTARALEFK
uniref:Uncharacterized protein n=1 Tax=Anguilla anguilla TaxID=7936 RepID=A0A0E9QG32_ANGAN